MAEEEKTVAKKPEEPETRIDEFAVGIFSAMGYAGRLPDSIVTCYTEFKRRKDTIYPGRLSPEGFAMVSVLSDMADRRVILSKGE